MDRRQKMVIQSLQTDLIQFASLVHVKWSIQYISNFQIQLKNSYSRGKKKKKKKNGMAEMRQVKYETVKKLWLRLIHGIRVKGKNSFYFLFLDFFCNDYLKKKKKKICCDESC